MIRFTKKILSLLTAAITISFLLVNVGAYNAEEQVEKFKQNNSDIICIAHRGDWHSYPENSAEAIRAATEYGVISIDLKLTSDKKIILMADDTVDRMCVDEDGNTVSGSVGSFTQNQLKEMYLRSANGSAKNSKTDFHPATLEDAVACVGDSAALMLNLRCADFTVVYDSVKALGIADRVIFRFSDKIKTIVETVNGVDDITVCGNYQGNIIFLATSAVKKSLGAGMNTVEIGSKNGNGVLYDSFLMNRFDENGKAFASMVNGRCGKRTDNEVGWDSLISCGYSVIETDYPAELSEYIIKVEDERTELERYLVLYKDTDTKPYTTDTENAFLTATSDAESILKSTASLSEIENARFKLQSSFDNLTVGKKKAVTLSFNFTIGRFVAAFLCGAAIIVSQILLYKRRDKTK